jgi:hypothetical protein
MNLLSEDGGIWCSMVCKDLVKDLLTLFGVDQVDVGKGFNPSVVRLLNG